MIFYSYLAAACLFGGLLNGVTGFGALIIMMPLLLLFLDLTVAVPLSVLCALALQGAGVALHLKYISGRAVLPLICGGLPGAWIGSVFLFHLPELQLKTTLGVLLAAYALWNLCSVRRRPEHPPAVFWAYAAGFCSGAFGGAFGITGPPAALYAARTDWTPDEIRGRLNAFFSLLYVVVLISQSIQGFFSTREVWLLACVAVPVCLAGSLCGRKIAHRLLPAQYLRLLFLLVLVTGVSLCRPALVRLLP